MNRYEEDMDFALTMIEGIEDLQHNNRSTYEARVVLNYYNLPEYSMHGFEEQEDGENKGVMGWIKRILQSIKEFLFGKKFDNDVENNDEVEKEIDKVIDSVKLKKEDLPDDLENLGKKMEEELANLSETLGAAAEVPIKEIKETEYKTFEDLERGRRISAEEEAAKEKAEKERKEFLKKYKEDSSKLHVVASRTIKGIVSDTFGGASRPFIDMFRSDVKSTKQEIDGIKIKQYDLSKIKDGDYDAYYKYNKKNIKALEKARKKLEKESKKRLDKLRKKALKGDTILEISTSVIIQNIDRCLDIGWKINRGFKAGCKKTKKWTKNVAENGSDFNKYADEIEDMENEEKEED